MDSKLIDLDLQPLKPTWSNRCLGEERIAKRLDRFLISEDLLEIDLMFKHWVDSGVDSDHLPICLEIRKQSKKFASPFKLSSAWLKNEEVVRLIKSKASLKRITKQLLLK